MAETKSEKGHNWNKHHLDKAGSLIEVCRLALKKVNSYETDAASDVLLEAMKHLDQIEVGDEDAAEG